MLDGEPNIADDDLACHGYNPGAPSPDEDLPQVVVEDIEDVPAGVLTAIQMYDPLQQSDSMGIDIYLSCLNSIHLS